ncbi:MAG: hypothetical protein PHT12_00165 [Patescibacteria group bacterium]|nr:hypothetical protein [Patescibacteria group bacterium]
MSDQQADPSGHEAAKIDDAAPESRVERKERKTEVHEYEYRDSEGRLLGRLELEIGTEDVEVPYHDKNLKMRRVQAVRIRGEKDGWPTEMDVLSLVNKHGAEILMPAEGEEEQPWVHLRERNQVLISGFDNPSRLATVLHEVGHADQTHDDKQAKLWEYYKASMDMRASRFPDFGGAKAALEAVYREFPEVVSSLGDKPLRAIEDAERTEREIQAVQTELPIFLARAKLLLDGGDENGTREQMLKYTQERLRLVNLQLEQNRQWVEIRQSAYLVVQILEADASNRAYAWIKQIMEETGVDLMAKHFAKLADAGLGSDCENALEPEELGQQDIEIETSIPETLLKFLESYEVKPPDKGQTR